MTITPANGSSDHRTVRQPVDQVAVGAAACGPREEQADDELRAVGAEGPRDEVGAVGDGWRRAWGSRVGLPQALHDGFEIVDRLGGVERPRLVGEAQQVRREPAVVDVRLVARHEPSARYSTGCRSAIQRATTGLYQTVAVCGA